MSHRSFALSLPEHPQTFHALLKGDRKLNTALGLKIERALGLEEGALNLLQMWYDIEQEKRKERSHVHPDLNKLRKALFWDTHVDSIDWQKNEKAVIRRVFERGNDQEKAEMIRFYGEGKVNSALEEQHHPH